MKKRSIIIVRCLFVVGVMSLLLGRAQVTATQANPGSSAKGVSMSLAYSTESPVIPLIDLATPSSVETASFGLG